MWVGRSLDAFRASPEDSYVAGRSWLYFGCRPGLFGYALWGSPTGDDLSSLVHVLELELDREPHAAVVDVSAVEKLSPDGFAVLASSVTHHASRLAQVVTAAAMVRSHGLNRAIASGFFSAVASPFPVTFVDDARAAFAAVGHPSPGDAAREPEEAIAASDAVPMVLRALRRHLDAHLADPSIAPAARAVGIAPRTLQRRLEELGTSFVIEVQEARVRAAERLLRETDASVTNIAVEVGCATSQAFSALFQRRRGETPTAFRSRHRPT